MRKILALLLALSMALALCACGDAAVKDEPAEEPAQEAEPQLDRNSIDAYLGTWEFGIMRFIINRGGAGKYEIKHYKDDPWSSKDTSSYSFTYEVKDEALVITIDFYNIVRHSIFELNEDGTALIIVQKDLPAWDPDLVEGETAFTKK